MASPPIRPPHRLATLRGWHGWTNLLLLLVFVTCGIIAFRMSVPPTVEPSNLDGPYVAYVPEAMIDAPTAANAAGRQPPERFLDEVVIGYENGLRVYRIRAVPEGDEIILDMAGKLLGIRDRDNRSMIHSAKGVASETAPPKMVYPSE